MAWYICKGVNGNGGKTKQRSGMKVNMRDDGDEQSVSPNTPTRDKIDRIRWGKTTYMSQKDANGNQRRK